MEGVLNGMMTTLERSLVRKQRTVCMCCGIFHAWSMVPKLGYCTTVLSTTVLTPLHSISYMLDDAKSVSSSGIMQSTLQLCHSPQYNYQFNQGHQHHTTQLLTPIVSIIQSISLYCLCLCSVCILLSYFWIFPSERLHASRKPHRGVSRPRLNDPLIIPF